MSYPKSRRGMTLIEVLIVVVILAVVIALMLPALNSGRDVGGRRTQCLSNVKNISLGIVHYVNTKGRYPNAGTFGDDARGTYTERINATPLEVVLAEDAANEDSYDRGPLHSWVVDILPRIDQQTLFNDFNRDRVYFDDPESFGARKDRTYDTTKASNLDVGETSISILRCPNDDTVDQASGNLSYAVNMGFIRWAGVPSEDKPDVVVGTSWRGSATGGKPNKFTWGPGGYALAKQTGVFFLGTRGGNAPWDMHHTPASINDGQSTTIMISENVIGGAAYGEKPYGWTFQGNELPMNWAAPHPNFVGFIASDDVCGTGSSVNCADVKDLGVTHAGEGPGWLRANRKGSFEEINYGAKNITQTGASPFANSLHPGGIVVGFCDGSVRFISDTIDGRVWAKLITPDGGNLPARFRQGPLTLNDLDRDESTR